MRGWFLRGLLPIVAALLLGAPAAAGAACGDQATPAAELPQPAFEGALVCLINQERAARGLGGFRGNAVLEKAAEGYNHSQLIGHFFGHSGDFAGNAGGSSVIGRLRQVGYIRPGWTWTVGEDLRWATEDESAPEDILDAWLASAEHRRLMLKPGFREIGLSAILGTPEAYSQPDGITVTADFGFRAARRR